MNDLDVDVLGIIWSCKTCSPREIASQREDLSAAMVVRVIHRLFKNGLIDVESDQPTKRGMEILRTRQRNLPGIPPRIAVPPAPEKSRSRRRAGVTLTDVLTEQEVVAIHARLRQLLPIRRMGWTRLIVFGLATFCGLRANEIASLNIGHIHLAGNRPFIHVPASIAKKESERDVPLYINWQFHQDLCDYFAWRFGPDWRQRIPELADVPVVVALRERVFVPSAGSRSLFGSDATAVVECYGRRLDRDTIRQKFISACKAGSRKRENQIVDVEKRGITTHKGRHTFGSICVHLGYDLAKVRDMMGHKNIKTTSIYLHAQPDDADINRFSQIYSLYGNKHEPAKRSATLRCRRTTTIVRAAEAASA